MRAWLEVDLDKIGRNMEVVRAQIGQGVGLIAVVKNDAYGLGLARIAHYLATQPIDMLAVIDVEEAFIIREHSSQPILVMGYVDSKDLVDAIEAGFVLSLYDKDLVPFYERVAARLGKIARVHVKVETGLNRLGMSVEDAADFLISQRLFPHIKVEGIYSHFADAGVETQNALQLHQLRDLLVKIQGKSEVLPIHLVSSKALTFKEGYFDAVRVGAALYGTDQFLPELEMAFTCKSVVMQVKPVAQGEGVSYGHLYRAPKDMTVAVVAIGYGEGLSQVMTGKMKVLVNGQKVSVVGQICMNLLMADVSGLAVKRGDEVVILGQQKDKEGNVETISVQELAKPALIGHHEIITRLGCGLPKFYSR